MNAIPKFQRKVLFGLARALADEDAHLRRFSNLANMTAFAGTVLVLLAAFLYRNAGAEIWVIASAAAGGFLLGLSIFYKSAVDQWPVVRRFLDVKALQDAAAKEAPRNQQEALS